MIADRLLAELSMNKGFNLLNQTTGRSTSLSIRPNLPAAIQSLNDMPLKGHSPKNPNERPDSNLTPREEGWHSEISPGAFDQARRRQQHQTFPPPRERETNVSLPSIAKSSDVKHPLQGATNCKIAGAGGKETNHIELDGTSLAVEAGEYDLPLLEVGGHCSLRAVNQMLCCRRTRWFMLSSVWSAHVEV